VTIWYAVSRIGIIGPHYFWREQKDNSVNYIRYVNMIDEFILTKFKEMDVGDV